MREGEASGFTTAYHQVAITQHFDAIVPVWLHICVLRS